MAAGQCSNCPEWAPKLVDGLCSACYMYRYRNGVDRPESVIVRSARRFNERQAERLYTYEYTGGY